MAALIALGGYVSLPLGPVPISLQTFFVMTAGFVLGPTNGALAVALYLLAGLVGLPVFAGGTAGIEKLLGPTGGFLFSFVPMAMIAGIATRDRSRPLTWLEGLAWGTAATVVTFLIGVPWLKLALDWGWLKALDAGFLPFLPGAVIKLVLSIATYRFLDRTGLIRRLHGGAGDRALSPSSAASPRPPAR